MPTELFTLTQDLRTLGGGRVWSLMVSLFGDLAQGKGEVIAGPVLSRIMAELGVKPEASRVALHRLRNDGWITSEKRGRISLHALSPEGRSKSAAASPRIYGSAANDAGDLQLVVLNPQDLDAEARLIDAGFIPVAPHSLVGHATLTPPADAAVFHARHLPDWMRACAVPVALTGAYDRLALSLEALDAGLPDPQTLSPLETAVLRCLVVHNWRRLVLRHPVPPAGLVDAHSGYARCRTLVGDLLTRYPRPPLSKITP